jgi:hypothetical protein
MTDMPERVWVGLARELDKQQASPRDSVLGQEQVF